MLCEVINHGLVYNCYFNRAITLGANLDVDNPKERRRNIKYKWRYGASIHENGDIYKLLNEELYGNITFCLIERLSDGQQFVIDKHGLKMKEYLLDDELFVL